MVENRKIVTTFYHFWEKGKKQFFIVFSLLLKRFSFLQIFVTFQLWAFTFFSKYRYQTNFFIKYRNTGSRASSITYVFLVFEKCMDRRTYA